MRCRWKDTDKLHKIGRVVIRCVRCGRHAIKRDDGKPTHATCWGWPHWWELGNWFKLFLEAFGITKERYDMARAKVGLPPCTTCPGRQVAMNSAGERLRDGLKFYLALAKRLHGSAYRKLREKLLPKNWHTHRGGDAQLDAATAPDASHLNADIPADNHPVSDFSAQNKHFLIPLK